MSRAYRLNRKLEILFTFNIKVKKIKVVNIFFLKVNIFKHWTISLLRCAHTPLQLWDLNYNKEEKFMQNVFIIAKTSKKKEWAWYAVMLDKHTIKWVPFYSKHKIIIYSFESDLKVSILLLRDVNTFSHDVINV